MRKFSDYNLKQSTYDFININHFEVPSQIQSKVIPLVLRGKDVIGISQTGTGKTHAFLIPIMEKIDTSVDKIQAVISSPTRELAAQLYNRALEMQKVNKDLRIKLIIGGNDKSKVNEGLKKQPHIVIGTPGRMKDLFLNDQTLMLNSADLFVVDEADMTLEFGFLEDVDSIASRMRNVQMLSFSATVPKRLEQFLAKYMQNPETVKVDEDTIFKPRVENILIPCRHYSYGETLMRLLNTFDPYLCLIFANTREEASNVAQMMRDEGYSLIELHGDLTSRERKNAMRRLDNDKQRYIVASDIAARGIDIDGVSHVVSLGFPKELDFYIHRSGRTGRAGKDGICYALYNKSDENSIRYLMKRGITFNHKKIIGKELSDLKPIFEKRVKKDDPLEREVSKIVNKKKKVVKPGYKKKRKAEIDKLKRKAKRDMIQSEIKKQAKERNKAKQRAKRNENEDW